MVQKIINNRLENNKLMTNNSLVTFDVFDTLITRKTATPQGIFSIVAQKINNPEFIPLRVYAAHNSAIITKLKYAKEDRSIFDIYNTMKMRFANIGDIEEWMNIEMSVPIMENIELVLDYMNPPRGRDRGVSNQPKSVSCCTNIRLYSGSFP